MAFAIQNKVTNVSFYAGQSLGDTNLVKSVEVDSKSGTWISTTIRGTSIANRKRCT